MTAVKAQEVRTSFLNFFASKHHKIVPSAPLVVKNDPTLFFINAGMNPFKDYFLGNSESPFPRVANTQKCLRVSGKHNDLEEVGKDHYHHTMFEMLGNWSFGDYFKEEAIDWSWEFLTEVCRLPKDRLYASVFEGNEEDGTEEDKEAYQLWQKYLPAERILRGSKKDNFWEMGDTGPCGPCSEIHIDLRGDEEREKIKGQLLVNNDHPEVIEIWNNVFIQFERKQDGTLIPLKKKFVDTGMGLERLVRAIHFSSSNYSSDLFTATMEAVEQITGKKYTHSSTMKDIAFRVVADHIRAISFSIADGQLPTNVGAGYVIRRILRRAIRYYYSFLDYKQPLLYQLVEVLQLTMGESFPELQQQTDYIKQIILQEEEVFLRTLSSGLKRLEMMMQKQEKTTPLSGKEVFELYDTFGFPFDLSKLIAEEHGCTVNEKEFEEELEKQKQRSRTAAQREMSDWVVLEEGDCQFVGYEQCTVDTRILRYRKVEEKGETYYQIVCKQTPFYAESGGQAGDTGVLTLHADGTPIPITNTLKENGVILHITPFPISLTLASSTVCTATIDTQRRQQLTQHHSATHLLQASLVHTLGTHVQQKGCLLSSEKIRFDFAHPKPLSVDECSAIEQLVNQKIRDNIAVQIRTMKKDEAIAMGATALFNEKYEDVVRTVAMDPSFSFELCGGTHVSHTGEIGYFKLINQSAVAAGVRRVEAVAGTSASLYIEKQIQELQEARELVKGGQRIRDFLQSQMQEIKELKKGNEQLRTELMDVEAREVLSSPANHCKGTLFYLTAAKENATIAHIKTLASLLSKKQTRCLFVVFGLVDGKLVIELRHQTPTLLSFPLEDLCRLVLRTFPQSSGGGKGNQFSIVSPYTSNETASLASSLEPLIQQLCNG